MDVILEIDGKIVGNSFNLRQQTAYKKIGEKVRFKLFRKGVGIKYITVKLEKRPGESMEVVSPLREGKSNP